MRIYGSVFAILSAFCAAAFSADPATAESQPILRTDTPSGYPVPRLVGLKGAKTYCRAGPSKQHPIRYTYYKQNAPMLVIAETFDHWRKLRDRDGDECWAHKSVLRGPGHAFTETEISLYTRPRPDGAIRGRIAGDVLVKVEKEKDGWVRISTGALRGWTRRDTLWGLPDAAIQLAATHN